MGKFCEREYSTCPEISSTAVIEALTAPYTVFFLQIQTRVYQTLVNTMENVKHTKMEAITVNVKNGTKVLSVSVSTFTFKTFLKKIK